MRESLAISRVHSVLAISLRRAAAIAGELGDEFPDYYDPRSGIWARNGGWTEGFWTGTLWRLYEYSRDPQMLNLARHYTRLLANRKRTFTDHDLGFLYEHSCALEYALTGNEGMAREALAAAERLAARFNPAGMFIRAHGELDDPDRAGYAIIDTLMNLELLFWAYGQKGHAEYYRIAAETAATIAREYVRPDYSTYQVVWFNPVAGTIERKATLQGYSADSCWSRGQAWGIYGFAQVYAATGEARYRDLSLALGRYFVRRLPPGGVAPYDFLDPAGIGVPTDTSAQAVAASGLLLLAQVFTGAERRALWDAAAGLLVPLLDGYLAPDHPEEGRSRGLLRGGCCFLARDRGVDSELMFGDYYLIEALVRYLDLWAWA